jgi:DNA-binding NarL/FixJ family response regulator
MTEEFRQTDQGAQKHRTLRILLVEHHPIVREGLRRLLEMESGLEVVAEVDNGEEACVAAQHWQPDIAIVDLALPSMGGVEAIQQIKAHCSTTAVVALTAYDDELYRQALMAAGAAAVILKDGHGQTLLHALRALS